MFEIGKTYWFSFNGIRTDKIISIKGRVLEENQFIVKVVRDDGVEEFIVIQKIINVNQVKDVSYVNQVKEEVIKTEKPFG